jgi:hypothetical protein
MRELLGEGGGLFMRTYQFPEGHPPGEGPWADEPDKAQWVDPSTNLDCLIVRNHSGALCGYVGVPPEHPWHGKGYDFLPVNVDVHGGLTFSGPCQEGAEDGPGVCHVPEPGRPFDVWWLGFDCAHAFDKMPRIEALTNYPIANSVYRTFAYVQAEVTRLASQIAAR